MSTTISRQISLLVKGILDKYKIDDLQLEIDLVASFQRMFTEGGKDPEKLSRIREDVLSSMLQGAAAENELAKMEGRVKRAMKISCDGRSRYSDMLRFLVKKDVEGQTVEQYAKWCESNPFNAPKFFQIADRPDRLMETWEMAFVEQVDEIRPEYIKVTNDENEPKAIPNPYKKPSILSRETDSNL
jgi:hypothetical protein